MSLDADLVVERRRLKRRLVFWRVLGISAVIAAVIAAVGQFDLVGSKDHIARIQIAGIIVDDQARDQALITIADDDKVKALIVKIDSPGGTYVGGEAIYQSLRMVAEKKPVVAMMGTTAASAGYMSALGGDHIVARASTLTGSIGVLLQTANINKLMDKIGVDPITIKSAPLKAQPNPMEPFSPEARKVTEELVADFFDMFVSLVSERRSMSKEKVLKLADGRAFSGRQAFANGLIDAIGAEPEVRKWLAEKHKIADDLPIKDVKVVDDDKTWRDLLDSKIGRFLFSERLSLDGVISLWQPNLW